MCIAVVSLITYHFHIRQFNYTVYCYTVPYSSPAEVSEKLYRILMKQNFKTKKVINSDDKFKKKIIEKLCNNYAKNKNPDISCIQDIR